MAGAYPNYPRFVQKRDMPADDDVWEFEDTAFDPTVASLSSYCKRCTKNIASGRRYERPAHKACGFCATQKRSACEFVS